MKYHVHVEGTGNAVQDPLWYLAASNDVSQVTISSGSRTRALAVVEDLEQAQRKGFHRFRVATEFDAQEADIMLVACGKTIQPGQSRDALFLANQAVIASRIRRIKSDAIVIAVTNPVDLVVSVLTSMLQARRGRVFGVGGELDAGRIRWALDRPDADVLVLGEHSETAAVLIDGVPMERSERSIQMRGRIRTSLDNQLNNLHAPMHCPGVHIVDLLDAVIKGVGRTRLVAVQHPLWGCAVTWPCRITRQGAEPLDIQLPAATVAAVQDIVEKNRAILRPVLPVAS